MNINLPYGRINNTMAESLSREINKNSEWILNIEVFTRICEHLGNHKLMRLPLETIINSLIIFLDSQSLM